MTFLSYIIYRRARWSIGSVLEGKANNIAKCKIQQNIVISVFNNWTCWTAMIGWMTSLWDGRKRFIMVD